MKGLARHLLLASFTILLCAWTHGVGVAPAGLVNLTVVENTGTTQTNAPLHFGLPLAAGVLDASHHVVATDPNNGALLCDENNRASDLAGWVRFVRPDCIDTITGNATVAVALSIASGAPATGTDSTTADLVAAATNDFNAKVTIVPKDGVTYTASPLDALNSGHSAYVDQVTPSILGLFTGGGGIVTGKELYVPLKGASATSVSLSGSVMTVNSGVTGTFAVGQRIAGVGITPGTYIASLGTGTGGTGTYNTSASMTTETNELVTAYHGQLYVRYDLEGWKASRAAVGGGNPILTTLTDVVIQSGVAQNANPQDDWYSLSVGPSGSCANFPTLSPASTLTLAGNTANAYTTGSNGSGGYTQDLVGALIVDSTGWGVITAGQTSTTLNVGVIKPFASTSLTSGNYKIYGLQHPYGQMYHVKCSWVPSGIAPNIAVEAGNIYLGNAWNNGALTGGPAAYLISTGMILNYQIAASAITNSALKTSFGVNPVGFSAGSLVGGGNLVGGNGASGTWAMYQEQSGYYDGVGPTPDSYIGALKRYDSHAAENIFYNADKFALLPDHVIDANTGVTPTMSSADWSFDSRWGTVIYLGCGCATALSSWSTYPNTSHQPDNFFVPYVMSGDWWYLNAETDLMFSEWGEVPPGAGGSGLNRVFLSGGASFQMRGTAHNHRNLASLALALPDSDVTATPSTVIGWTKTDALANLENQYTASNGSGNVGSSPTSGTIIALGTSTCPGGHTCNTSFLTPGPRWTELKGNDGSFQQWAGYQLNYFQIDEASNFKRGMLSAPHGLDFANWIFEGVISQFTDTAEVSPIQNVAMYWHFGDGVTPVYSWATQYQGDANSGRFGSYPPGPGRTPAGTMTLSATSGSSILVTLPASGYLGAGSFYVNGAVNTSDGGSCLVLASPAPTATTLHCQNTSFGSAFGSTSYNNASWLGATWFISNAAPGDTVGLEQAGLIANWTALGSAYGIGDYIHIAQASVILGCAYFAPTGCPGAVTTVLNYSGGVQALYGPPGNTDDPQAGMTWYVAP